MRVQDLLDAQGPPPQEVGLDWVWQLAQLRGDFSPLEGSSETSDDGFQAIDGRATHNTTQVLVDEDNGFATWSDIQIDTRGQLELKYAAVNSVPRMDRLICDAMQWVDPEGFTAASDSSDLDGKESKVDVSASALRTFLDRQTLRLSDGSAIDSTTTVSLANPDPVLPNSSKRLSSTGSQFRLWIPIGMAVACGVVAILAVFMRGGDDESFATNVPPISETNRDDRDSNLAGPSSSESYQESVSSRSDNDGATKLAMASDAFVGDAEIDVGLSAASSAEAGSGLNIEREFDLASDRIASAESLASGESAVVSASEMDLEDSSDQASQGSSIASTVNPDSDSPAAADGAADGASESVDSASDKDQVREASEIDVMSTLDDIAKDAQTDEQESELPTQKQTDLEPIALSTYPMMQLQKLPPKVRVRAREPAWRLRIAASEGFQVQPPGIQTLRPRESVRWAIEGDDSDEDAARIYVIAQLVGSRGNSIRWRIAAGAADLPQVVLPISQKHLDMAQVSLATSQNRLSAAIEFLTVLAKEVQKGRSAVYAQRRALESQRKLASRLLEVVSQANQFEGWLDGQLEVHAVFMDEAQTDSPPLLEFGSVEPRDNAGNAKGEIDTPTNSAAR